MTIECEILTVKAPKKIIATNMILSQTECAEPCNVTVTITWTNTGGVAGTFEPAIVVNGVRTGLGTNKNVEAGTSYTEIFSLSNLTINNYTICPDPN